jgi:hypothetical protein
MDRRSFGLWAALAAGWLGLWPRAGWEHDLAGSWQRQARWLNDALRDPASAARIGQAYLQAYPDEARIESLVAGLTAGWGEDRPWLGCAGREELRARLREQIRADFADRRTVRVQGWVLARSEARLFGLAALNAG